MHDPLEGLRQALADRYIIDREIGHGGFATVYLAQDLKLPRTVAIKVLDPELALAVRTGRFLQEIEIAAALQHPHILPLHDSGEADGIPYYVMPYVAGETLRDRLQREGRLSIEDALRIAREIAGALDYAHEHGIVHRDIKPGNVLMSTGHAVVADFGIAKASDAAGSSHSTQTGVLGTPTYMSPEQASGQPLDGRSDIYSLGCVVYEMIAGNPPFVGTSTQAVIAQHLVDPVPSICKARSDVPKHIEQAINRALAKSPDERFATAKDFAVALSGQRFAPVPDRSLKRRIYQSVAGLTLIAAVIAGVRATVSGRSPGGKDRSSSSLAALDTLRYLVLPFSYEGVPHGTLNANQRFLDALSHWHGITLTDPFRTREALAGGDGTELSADQATHMAAKLGAGRYARGEVVSIGDSIRVHVDLYDATGDGLPIRDGTARLAANDLHAPAAFERLAALVLLGADGGDLRIDTRNASLSLPARQLFALGVSRVSAWDLESADSAFGAATKYDDHFASAFLWQAQVRFWNGDPIATWASAAERAAAGSDQLARHDRTLSDALVALARGDIALACAHWGRATREALYDFAAWYGTATCLSRDSIVVRDKKSPSGWRFRSSYHHALKAYERAFRLNPAVHTTFRAEGYRSLRRLLMTDGDNVRWGRAIQPDTGRFGAEPAWQGDSITLIPYRFAVFSVGHGTGGIARDAAALHERALFHEIAVAWVSASPRSADALEALAVSLELLGDPAALDTLQHARALAGNLDDHVRIAASEVWLRLKRSVPSDIRGVRDACALADSLLSLPPPARHAPSWQLAALAALRGRASLAASLVRDPQSAALLDVPASLARDASALLAFAALGGPQDSLSELERRVESIIVTSLSPESRDEARLIWIGRPASLAFPDHVFHAVPDLAHHGDYLIDAEAASLRGDTTAVRRIFADLQNYRRTRRPADITFDGLYPEASVLVAIGERRQAIGWIDPTLDALPATAPGILADFARSGALVRTMILRAQLARATGEAVVAAKWARAVAVLWDGADAFLQPEVTRIKALAN